MGEAPLDKAENYGPPAGHIGDVVLRIRAEYQQIPGLCLTRAQAQSLLGLDEHVCDAVLNAFVDAGFLRLTAKGYVRT
jgi:hypothetical protein